MGNNDPNNEPQFEYSFKIALLGDEGTGKTSLVERFIENKFEVNYKPTLGVNIFIKKVQRPLPNGKEMGNVMLMLWDIAGQQRYEQIRPIYMQGSVGAIFVYDKTRLATYKNIKTKWLKDFMTYGSETTLRVLVGNKKDLVNDYRVDSKMGQQLSTEIKVQSFFETSAKSGENVNQMFDNLVYELLKKAIHKH
jgi:small GTP-binding protein